MTSNIDSKTLKGYNPLPKITKISIQPELEFNKATCHRYEHAKANRTKQIWYQSHMTEYCFKDYTELKWFVYTEKIKLKTRFLEMWWCHFDVEE